MPLSDMLFGNAHNVEQLVDIKQKKKIDKVLLKSIRVIRNKGNIQSWVKPEARFKEDLKLSDKVVDNILSAVGEYYNLDLSSHKDTLTSAKAITAYVKSNKVNASDSIYFFDISDVETDENNEVQPEGVETEPMPEAIVPTEKPVQPAVPEENVVEVPAPTERNDAEPEQVELKENTEELPADTDASTEGIMGWLKQKFDSLTINSKFGQWLYGMLGRGKDPLAIDYIDEKKLDKSKIKFFMEHEEECKVLLDWVTRPNYDLCKKLEPFGKMITDLYHFRKSYTVYRGIRSNSSFKHSQQAMGLLKEDGSGLKPEVKPGYEFAYTPTGPMSVARSIWISKVYGNVISKCRLTPSVNKLVITGELAYVLDKLQSTKYKQYRKINLSCLSEIVVFPDNKPMKWEVVTTTGNIAQAVQYGGNESLTLDEAVDKAAEAVETSTESLSSEAIPNGKKLISWADMLNSF